MQCPVRATRGSQWRGEPALKELPASGMTLQRLGCVPDLDALPHAQRWDTLHPFAFPLSLVVSVKMRPKVTGTE